MSLYELWGYGLVRVIYCPIRDDAVTACPLDIYHIKVVNSLKQIVIEEAVLEESREEGGGASKARRREGTLARAGVVIALELGGAEPYKAEEENSRLVG